MLLLFHDQMKVLTVLEEIEKSFQSGGAQNNGGVEKDHDRLYSRPLSFVKSNIEEVNKMDAHAQRTYTAVDIPTYSLNSRTDCLSSTIFWI